VQSRLVTHLVLLMHKILKLAFASMRDSALAVSLLAGLDFALLGLSVFLTHVGMRCNAILGHHQVLIGNLCTVR